MYSITEQFVTWLSSLGYQASTYPPADAPDEFVTVSREGGGVEDMVDHPLVAVQTWAKTEARAEEMGNAIRNEALTSSTPEGVHRIAVNSGPYAFWDSYTGGPRYQLVLDVTCQLTD